MDRTIAALCVTAIALQGCQRVKGTWAVTEMENGGEVLDFPVTYAYGSGTASERMALRFEGGGKGTWSYTYDQSEAGGTVDSISYRFSWEKVDGELSVRDEVEYLRLSCILASREMDCEGKLDGPVTMHLEPKKD